MPIQSIHNWVSWYLYLYYLEQKRKKIQTLGNLSENVVPPLSNLKYAKQIHHFNIKAIKKDVHTRRPIVFLVPQTLTYSHSP